MFLHVLIRALIRHMIHTCMCHMYCSVTQCTCTLIADVSRPVREHRGDKPVRLGPQRPLYGYHLVHQGVHQPARQETYQSAYTYRPHHRKYTCTFSVVRSNAHDSFHFSVTDHSKSANSIRTDVIVLPGDATFQTDVLWMTVYRLALIITCDFR